MIGMVEPGDRPPVVAPDPRRRAADAAPDDGGGGHSRRLSDDDRIADLHVWRVGLHYAIAPLVSPPPQACERYRARLPDLAWLSHVTVEVHRCNDEH